MSAFLFTFAIFLFWALAGFAVISAFKPKLRVLQGLLLSPALGVAVTILPVFLINRMGIPVKDFGGILLAALALASAAALAVSRPIFPIKRLLPYIGVLVGALVLAARPMFSYGFDWLSFSNDDMANYCLGAQRFLNNGYFDVPTNDALYYGTDYSQAFWFTHVAGGVRSGSELMLATIWAASGLNAHQVFMPVIMALNLVLIAATGAMVSGRSQKKLTPLVAMGILSISPLTTLGALYQLIGQVGGLALLCAGITMMQSFQGGKKKVTLWKKSVLGFILLAGIFIWYPEVLPFFGLGWITYIVLALKGHRENIVKSAVAMAIILTLIAIVLNGYAISSYKFLLAQSGVGALNDPNLAVFPYFLVPSGLPAFFGLSPIGGSFVEPFASLAIAVGILLFVGLLLEVVKSLKTHATPGACVIAVILVLAVRLFINENGFGLFKLSMFAQPFLAALIGQTYQGYSGKLKLILLALVVPITLTQWLYVDVSKGTYYGAMAELPKVSELKMAEEFKSTVESISDEQRKNTVLVLDSSNPALIKLQALYTKGIETVFPSRSIFYRFVPVSYVRSENNPNGYVDPYTTKEINGNKFELANLKINSSKKNIYIFPKARFDIFNAYNNDDVGGIGFRKVEAPSNYLVFIQSEHGNHPYNLGGYLANRRETSFFPLESDPLFHGRNFAALGSKILFKAINPPNESRVVMEITNTITKQHESRLPSPSVQSKQLNVIGRGSARVFSPIIKPSYIDDEAYITIDMGREGKPFPNEIRWLGLLYGRDISMDSRNIVTFGRDISLISNAQYDAMRPPLQLNKFPDDLADKNLEFSGMYEDGWVSESSYFVLSPPDVGDSLNVKGSIPLINDRDFLTLMTISINGKEINKKLLGVGDFSLSLPIEKPMYGRQRVEIRFDRDQILPGADARVVGGKLMGLGFMKQN